MLSLSKKQNYMMNLQEIIKEVDDGTWTTYNGDISFRSQSINNKRNSLYIFHIIKASSGKLQTCGCYGFERQSHS